MPYPFPLFWNELISFVTCYTPSSTLVITLCLVIDYFIELTAIYNSFYVVIADPLLIASLTALTASLRSLFLISGFLIA